MCSFAETTHTPQGDGNHHNQHMRRNIKKQPTPRKGTETRRSRRQTRRCWKQPTPRKGTETVKRVLNAPISKKQPTPRKGTETRYRAQYNEYKRKQPTPRKGTETGGTPCSASSPARNDPHPARGRKLSCRPYPHFLSGNDPHPARGRKPRAIRISSISEETTHTPQGDGNLHPVGKPINHSKQPTPRKGTET